MSAELTAELDAMLVDPMTKVREQAARVKRLVDVTLPPMRWRTAPCDRHETPDPTCEFQACGGELWRHQRVGISWLYFAKQGAVLDGTGTGKTNHPIGLIELLDVRKEPHRTLVVCGSTGSVLQWVNEFARFTPHRRVEAAIGTPRQRRMKYSRDWEVMICSANVMLKDERILKSIGLDILVDDDVDPIRHGDTQTSLLYNELARMTERVVNMNATQLQIDLMDLYWSTVSIGGYEVFGGPKQCERRYIRKEKFTRMDERTGRVITSFKTTGYRNIKEFKRLMNPMFVRRGIEDLDDDVAMPSVMPPENVWLELTPAQKRRYTELQAGVLRMIEEEGDRVRHADALAKFTYGRMICAGLQNIDKRDGEGLSVKVDWVVDKMLGEWLDEKVVVFSEYKWTIRAIRDRLVPRGCNVALIWGDHEGDKAEAYEREKQRFWQDPTCRLAIGTKAIERSHNLQVARILVNLDSLLNPLRMTQILGRVKRGGSRHKHVYVFNLWASDTQEKRYPQILKERQALHDYVFDDKSDLFPALTSLELLNLIRP
jgi:SNF2 family DNA or RNA helicase